MSKAYQSKEKRYKCRYNSRATQSSLQRSLSLSLSLQSFYFQKRCPAKQRAAINCIKMRFSSNILQTASNRNSTDKEQLACQTPQYKQQLAKNTAAADCGQYILQNKVKNPGPWPRTLGCTGNNWLKITLRWLKTRRFLHTSPHKMWLYWIYTTLLNNAVIKKHCLCFKI